MTTVAYWIDENGTEHQIDSSRPGAPGWSVVQFVDEGMDVSAVQNRHIVIRSKENAPGAATTATEGNESTNQQAGDSDMEFTHTPASYLVIAALAGVETIVSHTATFAGAVERSVSHATSYFGTTDFARYITDASVVAVADDGQVIGYRIKPLDRPVPEDEPSAEEVDAAELDDEIQELDSVVIDSGTGLTATLERYARRTAVAFSNHPDRLDRPEILAEDIPELVDALLNMHRTWLYAGGAA